MDSEPNYYEASVRILAEHGVTGFTWADHERYIGISIQETVSDWKTRYDLAAPVEAIVAAKNRHYLELARAGTRVYPENAVPQENADWPVLTYRQTGSNPVHYLTGGRSAGERDGFELTARGPDVLANAGVRDYLRALLAGTAARGTWGGPGREPGKFHSPWALAIDRYGRVHVLDTENHRVQRIGF